MSRSKAQKQGEKDRAKRAKMRKAMRKDGMSEAEIAEVIEGVRQLQTRARLSLVMSISPQVLRQANQSLHARGSTTHDYPARIHEPEPEQPVVDEAAIDAYYEQQRRRFDDAKHKPAHVDKLLTGAARATGTAATVVKRRKTVTLHQYKKLEE